MRNPEDYRPGIGIFLLNNKGDVFVAKRIDNTSEAWQMPQGGIDAGEEPLIALYRELLEETGIHKNNVTLLHEIDEWLYYDLPAHLALVLWGGRYKGQRQRWFVLKFNGKDSDINLETEIPEFNEWKWIKPENLSDVIVDFKRPLYTAILAKLKAGQIIT